jgi:hypothetical protein
MKVIRKKRNIVNKGLEQYESHRTNSHLVIGKNRTEKVEITSSRACHSELWNLARHVICRVDKAVPGDNARRPAQTVVKLDSSLVGLVGVIGGETRIPVVPNLGQCFVSLRAIELPFLLRILMSMQFCLVSPAVCRAK